MDAISRPPARPPELALEEAELVPEKEELKPEFSVTPTPIDEGLEEKLKAREQQGEKHDRPWWQVDSSPVGGSPP